jgi:hypothetical protein
VRAAGGGSGGRSPARGRDRADPRPAPPQEKKKWEPPAPPPRVGKKQKKRDAAASLGTKLPPVAPSARCKLRLLKLERIKDYLLMEHEFVQNQERLKPQDERNEEDRSKARFGGRRAGGAAGRGPCSCVRLHVRTRRARACAWQPPMLTIALFAPRAPP